MTARPPQRIVDGVLLASLVGLAACSSQGQTVEPDLFVTKPDDSFDGACLPRDCSLREAVAAANQAPGPNTIHIPAGDYKLTLTGAGEDGAATGDLDLTGDVTLLGAGADAGGTFIAAGPDFVDRLFHVLSGIAVLESLYVGGGKAEAGGAVLVEPSATMTARQARLDASTATGADGGGLIFNEGTLIVEGSRLTQGCSAAAGGAVVNNGTATLSDSFLENNEAAASGGAIVNRGGMTIGGTTINRAFAGSAQLCGPGGLGDGGGILNQGDLTITGGDISRTEATRSGGAVYSSGVLVMNGTILRSTSGGSGGGVTVASGGQATLTTVDILAVANGGDGGAIYVEAGGKATVVDSMVSGSASRGGGGVGNGGELTLQVSTISGSGAVDGGGIYSSGTLTVDSSAIRQGNAREHGGGVFALGVTTITNSTIAGNTADFGGGLFLQGSVTISNCTVSGNNATTSGGGVTLWGSGEISLTHCTLTHNLSPAASGLLADTYAFLNNTLIAGNGAGPNCEVRRGLVGIGNLDQDGSCGLAPEENLVGVDPGIRPLQDNGGLTETHLLVPDSPARNAAASAVCLPSDQRRIVRPQEGLCDIGAVEMEPGS